jgi:hypothetical protein
VKVGAIVTAILVVVVVLGMLLAGGDHGPMRHMPAGGSDGTWPIAVALHIISP